VRRSGWFCLKNLLPTKHHIQPSIKLQDNC
jgi:hypothetical protein